MGRASGPVLVTGAAGFIGSTLVDRLLADGRAVVGLDAFEPFYDRSAKERNLAGARSSRAFRFEELDTRDRAGLRELVEDVRPATIVDLAARAGVRDSIADPWLYIDINVRGLQNTLAAAAAVGAAVVFGSSSSVYGTDPRLPFREDRMAARPASPYGATKIAGEALVLAHHGLTSLPVRIARLFTVYGPRQRPDLAIHRFAGRILDGEPVPLYSNGLATRDFTYVDDIVDGLVRLADSGADELIVNLGSHGPISNLELVRALESVLGRAATIELLPPQPGDVPATFADIGRARETLGWEPRTTLDEGLRRFRDWFLAERSAGAGAPAGQAAVGPTPG